MVKNKRVAVVGPSPHIIGEKLGSHIDSFDIVIRINEFGLSSQLYEDYGSKTDIIFLALHENSSNIYKEMIRKYDLSTLNLAVCVHHEFNLQPYTVREKSLSIFEYYQDLKLDTKFEHLGDEKFFKRCKTFNCYPSTGSAAVYELLECGVKELYVTGVSFYTTKFQYNEEKSKIWKQFGPSNQNILRASGHNTKKEVAFLRSHCKKNKKIKINGDKVFEKIILSKINWYYPTKSFFSKYINLDYFKNAIKLLLRWLKVPNY
jgi:hypothetical protein